LTNHGQIIVKVLTMNKHVLIMIVK